MVQLWLNMMILPLAVNLKYKSKGEEILPSPKESKYMPYKDLQKKKEYNKLYLKKNREKLLQYQKDYRALHKIELSEKKKIYTATHKENKRKYDINYRIKNKERRKIYFRKHLINKYRTNIEYKILSNLRRRLLTVLKRNKKADSTIKLIGCSKQQLKSHLESKFKNNMNWNNYGRGGWVIDHILPCSSFDLSQELEQRRCFHYTNLQPLWEYENNLKRDKF